MLMNFHTYSGAWLYTYCQILLLLQHKLLAVQSSLQSSKFNTLIVILNSSHPKMKEFTVCLNIAIPVLNIWRCILWLLAIIVTCGGQLAFDAIIFLLTLWKSLQYGISNGTYSIYVLLRDGESFPSFVTFISVLMIAWIITGSMYFGYAKKNMYLWWHLLIHSIYQSDFHCWCD